MNNWLKQTTFIIALLTTPLVNAGLFDFIKDIDTSKLSIPTSSQLPANLSQTDVIAGLKEALKKGTTVAVNNLSQEGGFLNHEDVKVPIPSSLQPIASSLEMLGQGHLVDSFQATLNKAAEQAAPEAATIFANTIQNMSIDDAAQILNGSDTAATDYFKQHSSEQLLNKFLPIVKQSTDSAGVTSSYKQLIANSGSIGQLVSSQTPDLDTFVAQKAVDAMFLRIAEQEKLIRENPAARTTDLLKKVFTP
ncbi:DUF4197 domain-containing protein [Cycloclasticus sp.]|jgi:hypothetical protein|uniref:DUF4197 domain-containing protein n=1 Tax=Cycloclasticus sp. TaxID=2024830 RepID=UPI000C0DF6ED|nr:DUF4197 domain-containing protein [Cycloclasticus sp.]PHR50349.1 MAG: hypothetical protein COA48_07250 [Cycloclasticus sp.]